MMGLCTIVISFGAIISRASSTIAQTVGGSRAAFGPTFRIEGGAMIFSFFRPVCCFAEPICAPHFLESHFIPQVRVQVVIKWAPKQHSIRDLVGRWSGAARRAVPSARPGRRRRPRRTWRLPRRRLPGRRLPGRRLSFSGGTGGGGSLSS